VTCPLHQAALLHNVEFRYNWDLIYTYVGHLLLAVNPYKALGVYVEEMVQACVFPLSNLFIVSLFPLSYASNQARAPDGSRLAPHLFTLADNAFRRSGLICAFFCVL
jgi:myosin heavy subunit